MIAEKVIGRNTYYVTCMPPLEALSLLGDIQEVLTSSVNNVVEGDGDVLDKQINLGAIIANVGSKLKGPVLVGFAERILRENYVSVRKDGSAEAVRLNKLVQTEIFTGNIKEMLEVMYFVLEVNYKDFFDLVPGGFGAIMGAVRK